MLVKIITYTRNVYFRLHNDMASTDFEKRKEEEYEMQLLGFHSRAVYATLESITRETIESTCKKLCKSLQTKYDYDTEELRELKENEKQLIQTYCTRAMPHLKIIEKTVKKYISIPKNVLLEEDKCQSIRYTREEYERLEEHLENLQHRAKRATILNAALKEELATIDKLQNYISKSNEMCNIIENSSVDQNTNSDMLKVLKHYQELYKKLLRLVPKTEKVKYNPFEDFKGNDYDFDNL